MDDSNRFSSLDNQLMINIPEENKFENFPRDSFVEHTPNNITNNINNQKATFQPQHFPINDDSSSDEYESGYSESFKKSMSLYQQEKDEEQILNKNKNINKFNNYNNNYNIQNNNYNNNNYQNQNYNNFNNITPIPIKNNNYKNNKNTPSPAPIPLDSENLEEEGEREEKEEKRGRIRRRNNK